MREGVVLTWNKAVGGEIKVIVVEFLDGLGFLEESHLLVFYGFRLTDLWDHPETQLLEELVELLPFLAVGLRRRCASLCAFLSLSLLLFLDARYAVAFEPVFRHLDEAEEEWHPFLDKLYRLLLQQPVKTRII